MSHQAEVSIADQQKQKFLAARISIAGSIILFLISATVGIMVDSITLILDAAPVEDISGKVKKVVDQYKPRSFGVERLRIRKAGERIFVDVCFLVKESLMVAQVEELAQGFERDLKVRLPSCDAVVCFKPKRA